MAEGHADGTKARKTLIVEKVKYMLVWDEVAAGK